jgi:hypothetical protein
LRRNIMDVEAMVRVVSDLQGKLWILQFPLLFRNRANRRGAVRNLFRSGRMHLLLRGEGLRYHHCGAERQQRQSQSTNSRHLYSLPVAPAA